MKFGKILKRTAAKLARIIQKVLITVFLILIYFLGCGITLLFTSLFNRKLIHGSLKDRDSSWSKAEGYEPGLEESLRQS